MEIDIPRDYVRYVRMAVAAGVYSSTASAVWHLVANGLLHLQEDLEELEAGALSVDLLEGEKERLGFEVTEEQRQTMLRLRSKFDPVYNLSEEDIAAAACVEGLADLYVTLLDVVESMPHRPIDELIENDDDDEGRVTKP